jgi:hypothetical protein
MMPNKSYSTKPNSLKALLPGNQRYLALVDIFHESFAYEVRLTSQSKEKLATTIRYVFS